MATLRETYLALTEVLGEVMTQTDAPERGDAVVAPSANLHIHVPPNFSAFADAREPVRRAAEQGVRVLGVSNFFDFSVYGEFGEEALKRGVFPVFGLEAILLDEDLAQRGVRVNDPNNPGRMYLCGRGAGRLDDPNAAARKVLGNIRRVDSERMAHLIMLMNEIFEQAGIITRLNFASVVDDVMRRTHAPREAVHVQERHVAQTFQEAVFEMLAPDERADRLAGVLNMPGHEIPTEAAPLQALLRSRLMKAGGAAYVEEVFPKAEEGRRLMLELGAIPCYPILADGAADAMAEGKIEMPDAAKGMCEFEADPEQLIESLLERNIFMVELITPRNAPAVARRYARAMRAAGLLVTAGTEHNTLEMLPLAPTCAGGEALPDDLQAMFWEGACVVTAHQCLVQAGEAGFVDAEGKPNSDYAEPEARIAAFRVIGESILAKYFTAHPPAPGH